MDMEDRDGRMETNSPLINFLQPIQTLSQSKDQREDVVKNYNLSTDFGSSIKMNSQQWPR